MLFDTSTLHHVIIQLKRHWRREFCAPTNISKVRTDFIFHTSGTWISKFSRQASVPWWSTRTWMPNRASNSWVSWRPSRAGAAHHSRGQGSSKVSGQLSNLICTWEKTPEGQFLAHLLFNSGVNCRQRLSKISHHRSLSHIALWCAARLPVYPETQVNKTCLKCELIQLYYKTSTFNILPSIRSFSQFCTDWKNILTGTPVFPAIPGRPCSPWKPIGPCFPGSPLAPSSPCGPVTPLGPSSPRFPGYNQQEISIKYLIIFCKNEEINFFHTGAKNIHTSLIWSLTKLQPRSKLGLLRQCGGGFIWHLVAW